MIDDDHHPAQRTFKTLDSLSQKLSADNPEVPESYGKANYSKSDYSNIISFIAFLIVALNLDLNNTTFVIYKLIVFVLVILQYIILSHKDRSDAIKVICTVSYMMFGSSIAFTFIMSKYNSQELNPDFHTHAENNDIALNSICISIAYSFFKFPTQYIEKSKRLYITLALLKLVLVQSIIGYFSFKLLVYNFFYILIIWTQFHFVNQRLIKERESLQSSWNKTSADLQQDISKLKQEIKDAYKNFSSSSTSDADKLLMKLKFLRFELMIEERQNLKFIRKNSKKLSQVSSSPTKTKRTLGRKTVSDSLTSDLNEDDDDQMGRSSRNSWKLTTRDVDLIMQYLLSKKTALWIPDMKQKGLSQEATDFVMTHFTENFKELPEFQLDHGIKVFTTSNLKLLEMNPLNNYLEANIFKWSFDMFILKDLSQATCLIDYGYAAFRKCNMQSVLNIDKLTIQNFLSAVQNGYRNNPYHNALHGADVANSVGFFAINGLDEYYNPLEISCLVISALVHDIGHPGLNNAFLVSTKSPEALVYNDMSVLENFHATTFFKILSYDQSNILKNLNDKEWKSFRKLAISIILDTDLGKHFVIMNKFKNMIALKQYNMKEEADRHFVLSIALKSADIAHGAKEVQLHKKWSRRIIEEFFLQGDHEAQVSLPVTPMCDRKGNISKSQEGFLKVICLPLFESFEEFFINEGTGENIKKTCVPYIRTNIKYWEDEQVLEVTSLACLLINPNRIKAKELF